MRMLMLAAGLLLIAGCSWAREAVDAVSGAEGIEGKVEALTPLLPRWMAPIVGIVTPYIVGEVSEKNRKKDGRAEVMSAGPSDLED